MSNLPGKWRKGNLPKGWGKSHIPPHSSVPEEHPKPPVKTVKAGRQAEDTDNQDVYKRQGAGDYRIAALSARNSNGDSVTDVRYVSHKIYDGKPSLPGLPATFDREGKAQTLEVETLDAVTGLKATLLYTVFEDYPVLAKSCLLYTSRCV